MVAQLRQVLTLSCLSYLKASIHVQVHCAVQVALFLQNLDCKILVAILFNNIGQTSVSSLGETAWMECQKRNLSLL
jgi:hypothetical protein